MVTVFNSLKTTNWYLIIIIALCCFCFAPNSNSIISAVTISGTFIRDSHVFSFNSCSLFSLASWTALTSEKNCVTCSQQCCFKQRAVHRNSLVSELQVLKTHRARLPGAASSLINQSRGGGEQFTQCQWAMSVSNVCVYGFWKQERKEENDFTLKNNTCVWIRTEDKIKSQKRHSRC